jgi:hypothetical protein
MQSLWRMAAVAKARPDCDRNTMPITTARIFATRMATNYASAVTTRNEVID